MGNEQSVARYAPVEYAVLTPPTPSLYRNFSTDYNFRLIAGFLAIS